MLTYEMIKKLCKAKGVTVTGAERELGFARGSLCKINTNKPNIEKAQKLADYFGVTVDYLMNGIKEPQHKEITLTPKDERDIARDLDALMNKIETGDDSPLYYNGDEVDQESMELLRDAIGMSLRHLKIINKEKYNPRKNKSR